MLAGLFGGSLLALPLADCVALLDGDARVAQRCELRGEFGAARLLLRQRLIRSSLRFGCLLQRRLGSSGQPCELLLGYSGLLAERFR